MTGRGWDVARDPMVRGIKRAAFHLEGGSLLAGFIFARCTQARFVIRWNKYKNPRTVAKLAGVFADSASHPVGDFTRPGGRPGHVFYYGDMVA